MKNNRAMIIAFAVVLLFCTAGYGNAPGEGNGSLYEWTDDRGVVNVTDDISKVPEKYRSKARKLGQPGAGQEVISPRVTPASETAPGTPGPSDEDRKAQWQRRMRDAKQRLADAENRYSQLAQRKSEIMAQWGSAGAALPPQDVLDRMVQLDKEMEQAKNDIDAARTMVEVTIPDEARKASIPPGWLREVE